jgi:spermidine synthase
VKPVERLAEATAPDGSVLILYRHDGDYQLRVNGVELMSTRKSQSEERLAELGCAHLVEQPEARVLIGGLGFGFTLKAALRILPPDARIVVAELVAEVIAWNRNPGYALAGDAMRDPRVEVRNADVAQVLRTSAAAFDAILLDVDNGAQSLTTKGNEELYREAGVRAAMAALRPGGRLAYWSAEKDPRFRKTLQRVGLTVDEQHVRAHESSGAFYTLLIAHRRQRPPRS